LGDLRRGRLGGLALCEVVEFTCKGLLIFLLSYH